MLDSAVSGETDKLGPAGVSVHALHAICQNNVESILENETNETNETGNIAE